MVPRAQRRKAGARDRPGFLKTCLQYEKGIDLKPLLNAGAQDADIFAAIQEAIWEKPQGHHFGTPPAGGDERRNMNEIGG